MFLSPIWELNVFTSDPEISKTQIFNIINIRRIIPTRDYDRSSFLDRDFTDCLDILCT